MCWYIGVIYEKRHEMKIEKNNYAQVLKLDKYTELHVLDFTTFSESFTIKLKEHLINICTGESSSSLDIVKIRLKNFLSTKKEDTQSGAIAELLIACYLKILGYKQEYLYFNLEEGSIKKGFDGYYSNRGNTYIMESKSTLVSTKVKCHKNKVGEAYLDLKSYVEGKSKKGTNNPWRNAYNHASHSDVKSKKSVKQKLNALADNFDLKKFNLIEDFNIIPCSTIYSFPKESPCPNLSVLSQKLAFIDIKAKKKIIICIKSNAISSFFNFLDLL